LFEFFVGDESGCSPVAGEAGFGTVFDGEGALEGGAGAAPVGDGLVEAAGEGEEVEADAVVAGVEGGALGGVGVGDGGGAGLVGDAVAVSEGAVGPFVFVGDVCSAEFVEEGARFRRRWECAHDVSGPRTSVGSNECGPEWAISKPGCCVEPCDSSTTRLTRPVSRTDWFNGGIVIVAFDDVIVRW